MKSEFAGLLLLVIAITTIFILSDIRSSPRSVKKYPQVYKLTNNDDYPEITRGDFLDSSNYVDTIPKKEEYLIENSPRNPIKNPKLQSKQMCFDDSKTYIRDYDDGLLKALYVPVSKIECKYFNETDNYKESIYRYKDSDPVDRINRFRDSNPQNFIGKTVADVYDELSGSNDVKQNTDLLLHEGISFDPVNKKFKSMNSDRWHYDNENSINGGVIPGSFGIKGHSDNANAAIIY